ncbi:hypothetical protein ISCGN_031492 [Ixodes scapularis]
MPLVGRSGFGPRRWRCNRAFGCCFRLDVRRDGKSFRFSSVRFCPPTDSRAASLSVTRTRPELTTPATVTPTARLVHFVMTFVPSKRRVRGRNARLPP